MTGCLLGTAVGDAVGLPYESIARRRGVRMLGSPDRHRLLLGRGLLSDDTEHAAFTAAALVVSGGEPSAFERALAWRLRWWILGLPLVTGRATALAGVKLLLGVPPARSGVFSAGNGPAMRAPILGAAVADEDRLRTLVRISSRLTHTDPKAEYGAWAVALLARSMAEAVLQPERKALNATAFPDRLAATLPEDGDARELSELLRRAADSAARRQTPMEFAAEQGWTKGVSGYTYQTVPAVFQAVWRYPDDLPTAVSELIRCGGDTDSTAALAGGLLGIRLGESAVPRAWIDGVIDWPRTVGYLRRLADRLAEVIELGRPGRPPGYVWPAVPARNLAFLPLALLHLARRALPPY